MSDNEDMRVAWTDPENFVHLWVLSKIGNTGKIVRSSLNQADVWKMMAVTSVCELCTDLNEIVDRPISVVDSSRGPYYSVPIIRLSPRQTLRP